MSNALNKKSSGTPGHSSAEIFTEILSRISAVYVLLMTGVFPLFSTDMYYDILKDKFYFFFYATVAVAAICLIVLLIGILGGALRKQKDGTRPLKEIFRLTGTDYLFFAFLAVTIISTVASKWVYEAFWGTNGRLQGLFFYLIVALGWILVTKFYRFRMWHLYVFLCVGLLVCLWGITDYLGLDIFGWRADGDDYFGMLIFTAAIGNINTFTAVAALYAGVFAGLFLGGKANAFFMIGFVIAALAMIAGLSDNAALAACGLFAVLPFWVLQDRQKIGKFLILIALFAAAMALAGFGAPVWTLTRTPPERYNGLLLKAAIAMPKLFVILAAVFAGLGTALQLTAAGDARYRAKPFLILWGVCCLAALSAVIAALVDVNTAEALPVPEAIRKYLIIRDSWGNNRGYAWRTCLEFFRDFGFFNKLFGTGPETYGIFMDRNYYYEMIKTLGYVFDSPHSEALQYLFTTGILGFLTFYSTMANGIRTGLKTGGISAAFALGCVPYLFASLVNISTPISTPLLFLLLAMALAVKKHEKKV